MSDINAMVDQISGLSLLEASQLVKALEQKLGVSAAAPVAAAAASAPAGGGAAAPKAEEAATVTVTLMSGYPPEKKVSIIKALRECVAGLGLTDAKKLVEEAPKPIKADVPKAEAEEIKKKIETAGGKVEIK